MTFDPAAPEEFRPVDGLVYVRWCGGIWKVIAAAAGSSELKIRWVRGSRPDQGVFQTVHSRRVEPLNAMETLGLMGDEGIVP